MSAVYTYKPIQFFLTTIIFTWIPFFIAAYLSHQRGKEKLQLIMMFAGLVAPLVVALVMVNASKNHELIRDFWHRLLLVKINWSSLLMFLVLIPAVFFSATALSLLFGKSSEQFSFAKEINVMKGWQLLGLALPIILAPALEEIAWRGYGVDSL